jgi:hypothetical protein
MWNKLCEILHQVDEAWLDHGELILQSNNILARDAQYEDFLFFLEKYTLNYEKLFNKFASINKTLDHDLHDLDEHPDSNVKLVTDKIRFNFDQEKKMAEHEDLLRISADAIERSVILLRRTSQPSHKMWR